MSKAWRLVFVCSGNICRSPMAEGVARKQLEEAGIEACVISMGTLGIIGRPASILAQEVCARIGVEIGGHVSQGISIGLLRQADRILVMEEAHLELLKARYPDLVQVELLGSHDPRPGQVDADIGDPIGGTAETYQASLDRIEGSIRGLVEKLKGEGKEKPS